MKSEKGVDATFLGFEENMVQLLEVATEGLVQQRLLQRLQRGELALVEGFEVLGSLQHEGQTRFSLYAEKCRIDIKYDLLQYK